MALKHLHYRTESLLNIILNKINKEGRLIEGKPWVCVTQRHLSKVLKCTPRCVLSHIRKLVDEGILLKNQFNAKEHDRSNFYSINPLFCEAEGMSVFFSRAIVKKIHNIYSINITKSFNKSITSQYARETELLSDIAVAPKMEPANPPILEQQANKKPSNEKKPTTIQDMLMIWNEEIGRNDALSKSLSRYLLAGYQRKFGSSLEQWRKYVCDLKSSAYVMCKLLNRLGDRLLKWALSFKVINRIFAGGFGVTLGEVLGINSKTETSSEHDISEAEDQINSLNESEICKSIRREVLEKYGESEYLSWFKKVSLEERGNQIFLKSLSFITENVKLRYFMSDEGVIDAGENYVPEDVGDLEEKTQSELLSEGYMGSSAVRAALFGCRDLRLGR